MWVCVRERQREREKAKGIQRTVMETQRQGESDMRERARVRKLE